MRLRTYRNTGSRFLGGVCTLLLLSNLTYLALFLVTWKLADMGRFLFYIYAVGIGIADALLGLCICRLAYKWHRVALEIPYVLDGTTIPKERCSKRVCSAIFCFIVILPISLVIAFNFSEIKQKYPKPLYSRLSRIFEVVFSVFIIISCAV